MKLKTILVGYPGSQKIRKKVEYLNKKYLPDFDITYLNYDGKIEGWSQYMVDYMAPLTTQEVLVFSLDDYLVNAPVNQEKLDQAVELMKDKDVVCIKLCANSEEEFTEYPITTQYCLWNKDYLVSLLRQTTTPWDFEINGSRLFKEANDKKVLLETCLSYYTNSSLSSRWVGLNTTGLSEEDKKAIENL